jgi:hypothetical protein
MGVSTRRCIFVERQHLKVKSVTGCDRDCDQTGDRDCDQGHFRNWKRDCDRLSFSIGYKRERSHGQRISPSSQDR